MKTENRVISISAELFQKQILFIKKYFSQIFRINDSKVEKVNDIISSNALINASCKIIKSSETDAEIVKSLFNLETIDNWLLIL